MKAVELKSYKRHEIIFNHGEKGNEFFTVLKGILHFANLNSVLFEVKLFIFINLFFFLLGSALCLVLDPNYKKPIEKEIKQLIQEQ